MLFIFVKSKLNKVEEKIDLYLFGGVLVWNYLCGLVFVVLLVEC